MREKRTPKDVCGEAIFLGIESFFHNRAPEPIIKD